MNGADRDNEWSINTQSYLSDWEKIEIIPGSATEMEIPFLLNGDFSRYG